MALTPLATTTDLSDRKIAVPDGINVNALLEAASASIRDAAGTAITRTTATLKSLPVSGHWLELHLSPVRAITSVTRGDVDVTDYELIDGRLWRADGWRGHGWNFLTIEVDFGYDQAPADIVDLCCSLVAAGLAAIEDGYDPLRGQSSMSIDDYREGYATGESEVISPMELPDRVRQSLRRRFGVTASVVSTR